MTLPAPSTAATRVAAFDCGTNSLRLLVADISPDGTLAEVVRATRIVRLGQGVDATGEFAPEALERTFAVCEEYAAIVAEHAPAHLRFIATSATRDVRNREEFVDGVRERLGVEVDVITGDEEAALSFLGATHGGVAAARVDAPAPYLVMDLGGGSTELVLGTDAVEAALSMDIGSVRLTERFLDPEHTGAPPHAEAIAAARASVDEWYAKATAVVPVGKARTLVGVAGTITTLTAGVLGLTEYDRTAIHGAHLPVDRILESVEALLGMTREERAALPYLHPGRVDVIAAGALIFGRLVERLWADVEADGGSLTVIASETDILDGTALSLARSAQTSTHTTRPTEG